MDRNTNEETMELLLDWIRRHRRDDAPDPMQGEYDRRLQTLLTRFSKDRDLHRELLALSDLHGRLADRENDFHFRAGVQLGLALGSAAVL